MKLFILIFMIYSIFLSAVEAPWKVSPYISTSTGFDSNMLRTTVGELQLLFLKLAPGITVSNTNKEENSINFDGEVSYKYNLGLNSNDSLNDLISSNSNWNADLGLDMSFFKRGHFSPFIADNLQKTSYASYSDSINKFSNLLNIGFITTPFGQALKFKMEYFLNFNKTILTDSLSDNTRLAAEAQDNIGHDFSLGVEWKFLPKTSLILSGTYGFLLHPSSGTFNSIDSTPIKGSFGLKGIVTPKLAVLLLGGWNYTSFDNGVSFNGFITTLEFSYKFSKKSGLKLGYNKNIRDVVFATYLSYHNLYFSVNSQITNNIAFNLSTRATLNMFSDFNLSGGSLNIVYPKTRTDILISLSPGLSYSYKEYKFDLKYTLDKNITDFTTVINGDTTTYDYIKHQILLNASIFF